MILSVWWAFVFLSGLFGWVSVLLLQGGKKGKREEGKQRKGLGLDWVRGNE